MEKINVLLSGVTEAETELIHEMLDNVEHVLMLDGFESVEETLDILGSSSVDVVLIGTDPETGGYAAAEKICAEFPYVATILLETNLTEEIVHQALLVGIKDVLLKPFTPLKLMDTIYRSNQLVKQRAPEEVELQNYTRNLKTKGKVFTVFSTKGGVGKTFLSTNLAVGLAKKTNKSVVLVDLDLEFGNAALALDVPQRFTIADMIEDIHSLDEDIIERYLVPHESGVKVLSANSQPDLSDFVKAEQVDIILKSLQNTFDYIVVDMPGHFYEPANPALALADRLFIVSTPELLAIRNAKALLVILDKLSFPKSKICILLNGLVRRGEITEKDVAVTLNQEVYASIPESKAVSSSMNQGVPILLNDPANSISKSLDQLIQKILGEFGTKVKPSKGGISLGLQSIWPKRN